MFKVRNKRTYTKHIRKRPDTNVKPSVTKSMEVKVEKVTTKLVDVLIEDKQILPKEAKKVEEVPTPIVETEVKEVEEEITDVVEEEVKATPKRKPRKKKTDTENNETKE